MCQMLSSSVTEKWWTDYSLWQSLVYLDTPVGCCIEFCELLHNIIPVARGHIHLLQEPVITFIKIRSFAQWQTIWLTNYSLQVFSCIFGHYCSLLNKIWWFTGSKRSYTLVCFQSPGANRMSLLHIHLLQKHMFTFIKSKSFAQWQTVWLINYSLQVFLLMFEHYC